MHLFQVGQGTVQRIVIQVAKAINQHFSSTVTFPSGEMREKVERDFFHLCGIPGRKLDIDVTTARKKTYKLHKYYRHRRNH